MKKHLNFKAKAVLALTVVLAVVLALAGTFGPQKVVQTILTPLRAGAAGLTRQAQKLYSYMFRYDALEAENQELKARIAEMERDARVADTLQRENQRLRDLAELKQEREDYELTSAYIITWDSNDWTSSFTINKGSGSGIAEDMVAITAQGEVVGLVTAVGSNWATTSLPPAMRVWSRAHTPQGPRECSAWTICPQMRSSGTTNRWLRPVPPCTPGISFWATWRMPASMKPG